MYKFPSKLFFVGSLITLLLIGCKASDDGTTTDMKKTDSDDEKATIYHLPLTGETTTDREVTQKRPVAVIVNNDPQARPQSGLHQADLIYETLTEGKITRFLAFFQSEEPEMIGPVRSARDYYIDLAKGYDAFYVAHGWSPKAKEMLESNTIDNLNGLAHDGTLFERVSFRKAPHNSYISYDNIDKGADMQGDTLAKEVQPLPFLSEEDFPVIDENNEVESVKVNYGDHYDVTYEYDSTTETYARYVNEVLMANYETDDEVSIDNVFIIEAQHDVVDNAGRREINLTDGGQALLFQKGTVQRVQWENDNGRIVPTATEGKTGFVPGRTWINIIPDTPGIEADITF